MTNPDWAAEMLVWIARDARSPNPCNRCRAACCRELDVEVMEDDIEDIADFLDLPLAAVKRHVTAEPTRYLEGQPIHELVKGADGWCPFSREVAGRKRICGVHPIRPVACREFSADTCGLRELAF
ncbi:MAG: YkgJ family cysteine cluster protein [Planctomycetota bacterium]